MSSPDFPSRTVAIKTRKTSPGSDAAFLDLAREIGKTSYSAVLMSGGDLDCSRYSLAFSEPVCCLKSFGAKIILETAQDKISWEGDPLAELDRLIQSFAPDFDLGALPFAGGLAGYAAYELKNVIEKLPQTAEDDLGLPDLFFFLPSKIMIHDRHESSLTFLELETGMPPIPPAHSHDVCNGNHLKTGVPVSNFDPKDYMLAVEKVIAYIREGDIYQANLSQRFQFAFEGNPFALWERLFARNPAPFYAFIHAGDHQVVCTSMERFLYRKGSYIETRPIKGTRPRGKTPEEDQRMKEELASSVKEHSELSMIVDLLRNDISRICVGKSVKVTEHRRLEAYENVHHAVSIVAGELRPGITPGEILRGTFPGGSITGCPKIRSMEIIDELEPHVRHVYTGSIGYLGWHENMDLNIAIRTAVRKKDKAYFSVGGGIVFDSQPADEFDETLHKGRTLLETLKSL
ncbi:Chorismate binding-like protein [Desulfatibacillum aliphaticivorans]|uniref:Chorismate binding-like protein n=1 Tax=Desulfatibacillum aliphaticivorans TaxID=218208 RepID=B8F9I6_DESAL|nr:anthranilate synthase component I family protein [Desulfatibacillum aliphaticivorans]ACL02932.1 Chorismate binding-like protein [Desulfatibacillum aliphaticivorans]